MLVFGREHNWNDVLKFKTDNSYTMPMLPDPQRKIYAKFARQYIPRTYLVDKTGRIIFAHTGFDQSNFNDLLKLIELELSLD